MALALSENAAPVQLSLGCTADSGAWYAAEQQAAWLALLWMFVAMFVARFLRVLTQVFPCSLHCFPARLVHSGSLSWCCCRIHTHTEGTSDVQQKNKARPAAMLA